MKLLQSAVQTCRDLRHLIETLHRRNPTIELQTEAAECGYVCMSAVLALHGTPMLVQEIKAVAGTTTRGLSLRQLRDGLRACGAEAEVVRFDPKRALSYPERGIVLLSRGHYIVVGVRSRGRIQVFDPGVGWSWSSVRKLARVCNGFGVEVRRLQIPRLVKKKVRGADSQVPLKTVFGSRAGRKALAVFAVAQLATLTLPLLAMWSVDKAFNGISAGILAMVAIGFGALSLTNIIINLAAEVSQSRLKRRAAVSLSRMSFDALAGKDPYWFELNNGVTLNNRLSSLNVLLDYQVDLIRSIGTVSVTLVLGVAALVFVSPWLIVPGLCALLLTILIDLAFDQSRRNQIASAIEASQRRQAFVVDTLSQIPLIARFCALSSARRRFASLARSVAFVEARLQSLRGWRDAAVNFSKAGETLFFVTISAAFMGVGEFTIGGFVAVGAYKDLLANAAGTVFQLLLRKRSLEVHRLQSAGLFSARDKSNKAVREIENGSIEVEHVSFSYGSLDRMVVKNLSLCARQGECVVIRGPSGSGKSTLARLLVGALCPISGRVLIDGQPPSESMTGIASVLQSDRLLEGTIRDNVLLFRRGLSDKAVFEALNAAAIDDFVLRLPLGLNTVIGENVPGLSGGQRQRLLLARSLLGNPRLVILDEATSSLEVEIEGKILGYLKASGITTILMAHRPEVWAFADRVYTLGVDGQFCEETPKSDQAAA